MEKIDSLMPAAKASLWAGPIFVASFLVISAMDQLPLPVTVNGYGGLLILMLLVSAPAGFALCFLPTFLLSNMLGAISRYFPLVRPLPVWLAFGAALVVLPTRLAEQQSTVVAALGVTALATAMRCHSNWRWED